MSAFAWFGGIVAVLIGLAVLAGAVGYALDRAEHLLDMVRRHHRALVKRELGHEIWTEAYWFGESKETFIALQVIGEALMSQGGFSTDTTRDEWRKRIGSKP